MLFKTDLAAKAEVNAQHSQATAVAVALLGWTHRNVNCCVDSATTLAWACVSTRKGRLATRDETTACSLAWAVTAQLHQQLRLVVAVAMVATHLFQCQMVVAAVAIVATHLFQCQMVALSVAAWVQLLVADAVANSVADWVVVALAIANLVASSEVLLADADLVLLADADLVLPLADLVLLVLLVAADSKAVGSVVKDAAVAWHVWRAVASVLTTHIHTAEQSHTPHKHQETVQASHLLTLTRTTRLADLATS